MSLGLIAESYLVESDFEVGNEKGDCSGDDKISTDKKRKKERKHVPPPRSNYKCLLCDCSFSSSPYLRIHESRAHGKKISSGFKCHLCNIILDRRSRLKNHMKLHVDGTGTERPWQCSRCTCRYPTFNYLRAHENAVHNRNKNKAVTKHPCTTCGKTYIDIYSLAIHMYNHSGLKGFNCPSCNSYFNDRANSVRHLKTTHGRDETVACLEILKGSSASSVQEPSSKKLNTIHYPQLRPCEVMLTRCDSYLLQQPIAKGTVVSNIIKGVSNVTKRCLNPVGAKSEVELMKDEPDEELYGNTQNHSKLENVFGSGKCNHDPTEIKLTNPSKRIYKCPYCMEPFAEGIGLINHLPIHDKGSMKGTSITEPTFEYDHDHIRTQRNSKKLSSKAGTLLPTYSKSPQPGDNLKDSKRFRCRLCNYSCKMSHNLQIHTARHRKNGKQFRCSLCACYFRNLKALKIHVGHLHKGGIKGLKQK